MSAAEIRLVIVIIDVAACVLILVQFIAARREKKRHEAALAKIMADIEETRRLHYPERPPRDAVVRHVVQCETCATVIARKLPPSNLCAVGRQLADAATLPQ